MDPRAGASTPEPHSLPFLAFLAFTSLVCGALVMVLEILGSRVIGPFFGVSLFIWTSLIAVALLGLALGYAAGGSLADRKKGASYLYGIIFLAGPAVLLIPILKSAVLQATLLLGLRFGALTATFLLFGPAFFLLGCVSPYIIRIAARQLSSFGRTVGLLYAVSTFGGIIGTVCTGFILIAHFGVNQIFAFCGTALIFVSVLYFILFGKRYPCALLLAAPFLLPAPINIHSKLLDDGTRVTKIFETDTYYGNLRVLDYESSGWKKRELVVDGVVQGAIDLKSGMPLHDYFYYLQYIPFSLNASGKSCLVIGLGPGILPTWYEKMGVSTDVVEINPEIFTIAEKYFGFHSCGGRIVGDARYFFNTSQKKYDYVILDIFNGENTPSHLLSLESMRLISRRMNTGAILGINIIGSIGHESFVTASILKTMQQVFTTVEIFPTFEPGSHSPDIGNLEIIAYNHEALTLSKERLRAFPFHPEAAKGCSRMGEIFRLQPQTPGVVISDDYNPIDFYDIEVKEQFRKLITRGTNIDMAM